MLYYTVVTVLVLLVGSLVGGHHIQLRTAAVIWPMQAYIKLVCLSPAWESVLLMKFIRMFRKHILLPLPSLTNLASGFVVLLVKAVSNPPNTPPRIWEFLSNLDLNPGANRTMIITHKISSLRSSLREGVHPLKWWRSENSNLPCWTSGQRPTQLETSLWLLYYLTFFWLWLSTTVLSVWVKKKNLGQQKHCPHPFLGASSLLSIEFSLTVRSAKMLSTQKTLKELPPWHLLSKQVYYRNPSPSHGVPPTR